MKKIIKILSLIFLVILSALISIPFVFKGKIVELAKEEINKQVNAKVDFEDFSLNLFKSFPNFNFGIQGFSIIGQDIFDGDTLAYIPNIELTLDLSSVISGDQYEIKRISIQDSYIQVIVNRDGVSNYDIALADTSLVEDDEPSVFALSLKDFSLTNARIIYDDREGNMMADMNHFDLNFSGDFTASTTDLDLVAKITDFDFKMDGINYMKNSKLALDAIILADLNQFVFTFKENTLNWNNLNLRFDGWVAMPESDIDMDLKFDADKADFKTILSLVPAIYLTDLEGVKASGKAGFNGFVKGVYNDLLMPSFGINILVENGNFQYTDLPQSVEDVQIKASVLSPSSDLDQMKIDVSRFHFSVANNPMDIMLKLRTPMSDPDMEMVFKGKLNLSDVEKFYPLDEAMKLSGLMAMDLAIKGKQSSLDKEKYNEFLAKGFLNLTDLFYADVDMPNGLKISKMFMDFSPQFISLSQFEASYLETNIYADGKLTNYINYLFEDNAVLVGNLNLKSEYLNFDALMGSESSESVEESTSSTMEIFVIPNNIDFTLQTNLGRIKYDNIEINSLYGKLRIAESRVNLEDLNMEMLGGKMNLSGYYSTINPLIPSVSLLMGIKDFNIKKSYDAFNTIQFFAPISKYIEGSFSTFLTYHSDLDLTMSPKLNTVDMEGMVKTSTLSIKGSPAFSMIASELKYDKLNNLNAKPAMIDFVIHDGNLVVRPFDIMIDDIPGRVYGTANLDQTIDYKLNMQLPIKKLGVQANKMIAGLKSQAASVGVDVATTDVIPVNISFSGSALKPSIKIEVVNPVQDAQDQLQTLVKDEIQNAKDKAAEELEKQKQEALLRAEQLKKQAQDSLTNVINKQKEELERKKREAEEKAKKKLEEEAKKKLKNFF